ncbi:MAG: LPXTG cell wall anchor domain-containing protein [Brevinematales bacterium]
MVWWWLLLVPVFPTNEIPMMQRVEAFYPVEGEIVSYAFQEDLSPFVFVEYHTNERGIVITLEHVSLSSLSIPPLDVVTVVKGKTNRLVFEKWILRVTPTNVSVSNLHPVEDIYPVYDFWWVVWVVFGLVLLVGGIWFFWKKKKAKQEEQRLSSETLEDYLSRLQAEGELMDEKTYYSEVAYFVRWVLETAYGFPAKEMGSREIGAFLSVDKEWKERILDVLKWCDRVKYAKHTTSLEKRKQILKESEEIYKYLVPSKEENE